MKARSALTADELSRLGARLPGVLESPVVEQLAVLATFDPDAAVPPEFRLEVQAVSDQLADHDGRPEWMLKERTRVHTLARMLRVGGRDALIAARPCAPTVRESALQRMLDTALAGQPVDPDALTQDELVAALHVARWCTAAGSLGGRPDLLPAGFDREQLDGRLALLETTRPIREITRDGCVGRQAERDRLRRHVEAGAPYTNLIQHPALLVYGVGGVGKSTLVAQFVLDVIDESARRPTGWAYLDLDRPSLSGYQPLELLADINRQVSAQFPQTRRYLDLNSSEAFESSSGYGLDVEGIESWRTLVGILARTVNAVCDGRLVVIVDTFEELQRAEARRGGHRISEQLYRMFAELSDQLAHFRLVVCGRAPAATFLSTRQTDQLLHVEAFRGAAAVDLLQHLYQREMRRRDQSSAAGPLDPALAETVVQTVGGSPLSLKLAARVLALEGAASVQSAADRAHTVGMVREEFVKGFLYHRVLGHLRGRRREDAEPLCEVARAGLVLRQVTAELLRAVVFPAIGRADLNAEDMMAGLAAETALADENNGVLRLRDELRGPALLALRYDRPGLVDDVHRRAAAYYAQHPDLAAAPTEYAYHVLATGDPVAAGRLDPSAVRDLERSLADLPADSRALVERTVADPSSLDEGLARQALEREIEAEARRALDDDRLDDAAGLLANPESWAPTTPLYRYAAELAETRRDTDAALDAARRDVAAAAAAQEPERFCAAAIRHALLAERTHNEAAGVDILTDADGQPWLGGHRLLRLELQLNRLAMVERADPDADTWLLDLDAAALLHGADASAVKTTTALVRLLAATLGRDDPGYVLDAVRSVGLGPATHATHLRQLADALADWDTDRPEPGEISRALGLAPTGHAWLQAIVGSSADAVPLLDRAFSQETPSPGVLAALRRIYLWWGVDPERAAWAADAPEPHESAPHFLDQPLDAGDSRVERLLRTLTGAYPTAGDLQVLAARAGVDVAALNVQQTHGRVTREVLELATYSGRLGAVVEQVLADPATAAFHDEIRALVGPDWLARHGIDR